MTSSLPFSLPPSGGVTKTLARRGENRKVSHVTPCARRVLATQFPRLHPPSRTSDFCQQRSLSFCSLQRLVKTPVIVLKKSLSTDQDDSSRKQRDHSR